MDWFGPKLEPGEHSVLRHPPIWLDAALVALIAAVAAAPTATDLMQGRIRSWTDGTIAADATIGVILLLAALFVFGRWRVLVTDRRVYLRQGFWGWSVMTIRRAEIEAAYFHGATLFIEGKGRVISTDCLARLAGPLLKQIDPLYDNLKLRTPGLPKILVPRERVIVRLRRPVLEVLTWTLLPAVPLLVLLLLIRHPDVLNPWFDLLPGLLELVAFFLFMLFLVVAFHIAFAGLYFDHWRIALTDRRILVRRGILATRHDAMAREEIETIRYTPAERRLFIAGRGREMVIRCFAGEAKKIVHALDRQTEGIR